MNSPEFKAVYITDTPPARMELFTGFPDLLTPDHMSEITGMSADTVRSLIRRGELPACRIGHRYYVPKTKFVEFVESEVSND